MRVLGLLMFSLPLLAGEKVVFNQVLKPCRAELKSAQTLLDTILRTKTQPSEAKTLKAYNQLQMHLDAASSLPSLLAEVHPSAKLRKEAEQCQQEAEKFHTELSLNTKLYEVFKALETAKLTEGAKRLVTETLRDFRRSGVDKDEATRTKIKALEEELTLIGQDFGRNIRDDQRFIEVDPQTGLKGLPEDYIKAHKPGKNGKVKITTDYPDFIPYMSYAEDAGSRKALWILFNQRGAPQNEEVLQKLINKRHELAKLLGYNSFADYVVEDKMVKSTQRAGDFINQIAEISKKMADREYALLLAEKQKLDPKAKEVAAWEKAFLEERIKRAKYEVNSQEVRSHFKFPKVREGLLGVTGKLYGLSFKRVKPETWDKSVEVYDVLKTGQKIGRIYLDLHPRENKFKHAAQFTVRNGVKGVQLPEGALVCNFGKESMDHDEVVTFFHEFGHLMHHILGGNQKWVHFSGVSTEWDFVEAPSQFFEEWAWDPKVLQTFSKIPTELVVKMKAADEFGKGVDTRRQMFLAALSLNYYLRDPSTFKPQALMETLQAQYSPFAYVPGTQFQLSFGHLHDYSAMYYTYMWSKVIAKDFASAFQKKGLMDLAQSRKYARTILAAGGSKDADVLVEDFLGRPYQFDAFKAWLEKGEDT